MTSGITPDNECMTAFTALKMNNEYRYIIFKIEDKCRMVVDKTAPRSATYDDFLKDLEQRTNEGCYAVIDFECPNVAGSYLIFVSWLNERLPAQKKMLYASSKAALKKQFLGMKADVHADNLGDISESVLIALAERLSQSTK